MAAESNNDNGAPLSEWMKVMLEEIERKDSEQAQAREELARRRQEGEQGRGTDDEPTDANG